MVLNLLSNQALAASSTEDSEPLAQDSNLLGIVGDIDLYRPGFRGGAHRACTPTPFAILCCPPVGRGSPSHTHPMVSAIPLTNSWIQACFIRILLHILVHFHFVDPP